MLRERALASVDDPNTTLSIFERALKRWLRRRRRGRDSLGHAGALGYTVSHEAILSSLAMDPPPVFRTEVTCQNVPSLDEPVSPLAWSSCADPAQAIRAPSAFTDHEPEDSSPLDLIVAGTTSPSPSAFHIIDHLVAGAP